MSSYLNITVAFWMFKQNEMESLV